LVSSSNVAILANNINKRTTLDYLVITATDGSSQIKDTDTAAKASSYGIQAINSDGLIIK